MSIQLPIAKLCFKSLECVGCPVWKKPLIVIASGFGLGCFPVASGTAGTIPGVLLVMAMSPFSLLSRIVIAALLVPLAVYLCDVAEKHFGVKDDHRIVADEFLTFPICMLGLPLTPWVLCMAFVTNRIMDIIKPPPARGLQRLPGGWGIAIDDTISSFYSLLLNHAIYALVIFWMA